MLNKPIKFKMMAMLSMALIFWLSGVSLFAQNKQANSAEPEKKQVPSAQPKVSLSNHQQKVVKQDAATMKKVAMEQKRKDEQAAEAKKQNLAKKNAKETKKSKQTQSTSAIAPVKATQPLTANNEATSANVQKDWEVKKAKLIQSLKDKNFSQQEIDKAISKVERDMNNSMNKTK